MKNFLFVGVIVFLSTFHIYAQLQNVVQNQYRFKYITVDQGLSNNQILSICQDVKGFIWIATQNGVDRFDGRNIVSFAHNPFDSLTISSNIVYAIFSDSQGNLWFGNEGGLDLYNNDYNNFNSFSHKDIYQPLGIVYALAEDKDGKIWIGAETGLYSYDLNTSKIQFFSNNEDNPHGIPPNSIFRLIIDKNNNVWFSAINYGICVYYQNEGIIKCFRNDPDDSSTLSNDRIHGLYEDKNGRIWVGTLNDGLNLYIPESNSFIRTLPDVNKSYARRISTIFEDQKGNFFVGTRAGIYLRNNLTNKYIHYAYEGHNFSNLIQNSITTSYVDKTGILWLGTHSGGVNYTNFNRKEFIHFRAGKDDNHFLNGSSIYAITEDSEGNLWVGGDNGLNFLDRTTYTFTYYSNDPDDPYSLSYNDIKALEWDKKGDLWIGTNNGGLNYYNSETGRFKSYRHDPDNPNSISGNKVYGLINDTDDNLWIICGITSNINRNIDILPKGSDKFIHLNEKAFLGFHQSANGDIYIGGTNGFWIFSSKDSVFSFISNDTLIGNVNTITKDSKNRIWVGSNKGLVRYDMEDKSFTCFSKDNGYPISEVYGILEDDSKNLWVSTNFGLIKLTNIVEDMNEIKYRVFDSEDGLQSKQFNYNAYYKCKSGEMAFGGINGFNTFYPNEIVVNPIPPNVIITDLKIFNKSALIGEKVEGRLILKKTISDTKEIQLGRKQNVFTLEFVALHYANPEKNMYKYKLEGFDKDWQFRQAGNNFATYSNLSAGKYTFIVTAANNDGVWNEEDPAILEILIVPPFWKTWWFYILIIIAIVAAIWMFMKIREKQLQADKNRLENELNRGKAEIEAQKDEIQKQQEAIKIKEEQEAVSKWHNEGIVKFSDIIRSNKENVKKLSQEVLSNLVTYVEADQGGIFLTTQDGDSDDEQILELVAAYAYSKEKLYKKHFKSGEGLIGACFIEGTVNKIDNLPENYTNINSGLGKKSPKYLLLVPIMLDEFKIGVLELASFKKIDDYKVEFIEKINENIASIISIVLGGEQAMKAVQQANEKAEELRAQEEEMRQNLEEMQATQEELSRHREKLEIEQQMLNTLIENLPGEISFKDTEGNYIKINSIRAKSIDLVDAKNAVGHSDFDFIDKNIAGANTREEKDVIKSNRKIENAVKKVINEKGNIIYNSISIIPFDNDQGKIIGTLRYTNDITSQKKLESKVLNCDEVANFIANKFNIIIYMLSSKFNITDIKGKPLNVMNIDIKTVLNKNIVSVFPSLNEQFKNISKPGKYELKSDDTFNSKSLKLIHHIISNEDEVIGIAFEK